MSLSRTEPVAELQDFGRRRCRPRVPNRKRHSLLLLLLMSTRCHASRRPSRLWILRPRSRCAPSGRGANGGSPRNPRSSTIMHMHMHMHMCMHMCMH
eukprot:scaffold93176_cov48-Phaeocystis_antarctica.AAC.1